MKISFIESPEGLEVGTEQWESLQSQIIDQHSDVLITNEMPFGNWLAVSSEYNQELASASIAAHSAGIEGLKGLQLPLILSSQPVLTGDCLANEAFAMVQGHYQAVHHKHYFPQEPGFYEASWFKANKTGFNIIKTPLLNVGFLLCTELMFNEWARHYGRNGAQLIAVPRAAGQTYNHWKTAAAMAAIVSGCYVVSANRSGATADGQIFGGKSFAYAPDGCLICETDNTHPVCSFEVDLDWVARAQREYPCYVSELSFPNAI